MAFNPSSINLEVLFDSKEKAENFIKKFADGYKQTMSSYLNLKENESTKNRLNSPKPIQNYYGLKHLYESKIITDLERRIRKKIKSKNPGLSEAQINLIFGQEKGTNIEFLRKNLEYTRVSAAFNAIKPDGELESAIPNGFSLGKETCGTCKKEREGKEKGWKLAEWKKRGIPKTFFCSQSCLDKFDWDSYNSDSGSPPKTNNCFFCQQKYQHGVYFGDNPGMVFCSEKCARSWEKEIWDKKNLADQRIDFITESLEKLSGWNLLTAEEKENFIRQVNSSEPKQFKNIFEQVKQLVSKKRKSEEDQTSGEGDSSDNDNSNTAIPESPPPNLPEPQNDNEPVTNNLPTDIQVIANLPLTKAKAKAEQEIEKLLKDNGLSEQELDTKELLDKSTWKDYLKQLDTSTKVAEFVNQMRQAILKKKLTRQTPPSDSKPKNSWILPVIILVVLAFAALNLIMIVRKRRRKNFQ